MELLRPAALRPCDAAARAAAPARHDGPAPQARPRAELSPTRRPGRPRGHHQHGDLPVRHGRGRAWDRVHPRLTHRAAWLDHVGQLPVIEGTLIRLHRRSPARRPGPKPCGCGAPAPAPPPGGGPAAGRRSCAASTWSTPSGCSSRSWAGTAPKIRDPAAADRWTWLIIACHAQLRLARPLAADLRRPWERPGPPGRLTPARVRRGFRCSAEDRTPAGAPKPGQPGPGTPARLHEPAPCHPATTSARRRKENAPQNAALKRRLNGKLRVLGCPCGTSCMCENRWWLPADAGFAWCFEPV